MCVAKRGLQQLQGELPSFILYTHLYIQVDSGLLNILTAWFSRRGYRGKMPRGRYPHERAGGDSVLVTLNPLLHLQVAVPR